MAIAQPATEPHNAYTRQQVFSECGITDWLTAAEMSYIRALCIGLGKNQTVFWSKARLSGVIPCTRHKVGIMEERLGPKGLGILVISYRSNNVSNISFAYAEYWQITDKNRKRYRFSENYEKYWGLSRPDFRKGRYDSAAKVVEQARSLISCYLSW